MTSYRTDRARAAAYAADNAAYSRRRLGSGVVLGIIFVVALALILGFMLVGDVGAGLKARIGSTAISCLIATPVVFALGFAIGLSGRLRRLGMGIVLGALIGTVVIVVLFLPFR